MGVSDNFIGLIQRTSDGFIRDNIYMVDKSLLARALVNIDPQYQEKIFKNMAGGSAEEVKRLIAGLGNIDSDAIESAQREIMSLASQVI